MKSEMEMHNNKTVIDVYGSFFIGGTEFAINVRSVQEVVNYPKVVTKVPLAPSFVEGVFNLRGLIIPIVNLKSLLKISDSPASASQKVAIVEHNGVRVGLLLDSTGEVLRVNKQDVDEFEYAEEDVKHIITGAIRLDNGNRLLQLVNPEALVKIENIPHVLDNQKKNAEAHRSQKGKRQKCIAFSCAGVSMAIEISGIHEILRVPEIKPSVFTSPLCEGLITVRGQIIPVINLAAMIAGDKPKKTDLVDHRIIILKIEKNLFGFLVDEVNNINSYYNDDVMPIPLLSPERAEMFLGCIEFQGGTQTILLNHQKILSNKEIVELVQGHSKLYQTQDENESSKKAGQRHVYISFRLDQLFGVPINEVKEIIEQPKELVNAPGLPSYMSGVLNLRGQLITIIDARKFYQLNSQAPATPPKVLIFQSGTEKFGLLVDSVESILTIHEGQKMALPKVFYQKTFDHYQNDIKEALEIPSEGGTKTALMILNIEALSQRLRLEKSA